MQVSKRRATLAMTLLLAATACGGGGDGEGATPTAPEGPRSTTSSSTTTTTEPVDPSVVPDDLEDIDEEYVEAVLNAHNRVIGDALRLQLEGADISEIMDRYNAIYVPEVADLLLTDALGEDEAALSDYKRPPGDASTTVVSVSEVSADCIAATVEQDTSAFLLEPPPPFVAEVVLRRVDSVSDGSGLNPTAWMSEGFEPPVEDGGLRCDEG